MRGRTKLVPLAVALCLAGAGCSNGSSSSSSTPSAAVTTTEAEAEASPAAAPVQLQGTVNNKGTKDITGDGMAPEVELEQDNFYFEPTFVKARAGAKIKFEIENEGTAPHTFTIKALGIDEELQPGASKDVEVTVPSTGALNFICRFHVGQGMQGAIFTKDGDAVVSDAAPTTAAAAARTAATTPKKTSSGSGSGSSGSGSGSGSGSSGAPRTTSAYDY